MPRLQKMQVLIDAKFIFLIQNQEIGELHKCGCGNLLYSMHKNGERNEKCASAPTNGVSERADVQKDSFFLVGRDKFQ